MIKLAKKIVAWSAAVGSFFAAQGALADSTNVTLANPLGTTDFTVVLNNFLAFLFTDIVLPLTVIMVLVGAIQFITSAGNPEKISKARSTLMYAAIGVVVALLATSVTNILKSIIGQ